MLLGSDPIDDAFIARAQALFAETEKTRAQWAPLLPVGISCKEKATRRE